MNSVHSMMDQLNKVILGKEQLIKSITTCLIANGHVLIEDVPGVGKTTLVKALAHTLNAQFQRVQGTSDLLPSDILGVSIFDKNQGDFHFKPGPIFTQILLFDELNRASPKTQSALLQAMEERGISVDKELHLLPEPFLVMATQNPQEQIGTYPLPESQIDRFLMKLSVGFLAREQELSLIKKGGIDLTFFEQPGQWSMDDLRSWRQAAKRAYISDYLYDYLLDLIDYSRQSQHLRSLSPRASLDMISALKAWSVVEQREEILPDDVQELIPLVWGHRLSIENYSSIEQELKCSRYLIENVAIR